MVDHQPTILPPIYAPTHSHDRLNDPRTHAPTHPRTHAPTHPRTHAPTHARTHAPTHAPVVVRVVPRVHDAQRHSSVRGEPTHGDGRLAEHAIVVVAAAALLLLLRPLRPLPLLLLLQSLARVVLVFEGGQQRLDGAACRNPVRHVRWGGCSCLHARR
jgi:hypothetical protein